jgi:hypothetical protein
MKDRLDAYLDIETTGLSFLYNYITVVGIYLCENGSDKLVQLVGEEVTKDNLVQSLEGVNTIYTYNGSRFDFPFVATHLGVNLNSRFRHHDLMYDCWKANLYGGLKAVERQLRIPRQLQGIGGVEAIMLWWRYQNYRDRDALALLLQYNEEDVVNLRVLRNRLANYNGQKTKWGYYE